MNTVGAVADFTALGYDAIPLHPGSKLPVCAGYPTLSPAVQWATAPDGANIGLRGGGELGAAFVDCDDKNAPGTAATVRRLLSGKGLDPDGSYPAVLTVSGGSHFYVRAGVHLLGHYRNLRRELGAGELRYGPAAFVVAPGSVVDGRAYELVQGDLRQVPALDLADLRDLADGIELASPVATAPNVPRLAQRLLLGETAERYHSRSEAEQAIVNSLVNAGHDFGSILLLFMRHPAAGKFAELRQHNEHDAIRWLRRSYDAALRFTARETTGRARGRAAQAWALSRPWPGRTGSTDRAVYLAHAEIARRAGVLAYAAPVRTLAELAGVSCPTAMAANARLTDAGLVRHDRASAGTFAALYTLTDDAREKMRSFTTSSQGGCEEVVKGCTFSDDAFRFFGLGKAACEVLAVLHRTPGLTAGELAALTGRHVVTVRRALARMAEIVDSATGEVLRLVAKDGHGWRALDDVDLVAVARAVGTLGAGKRQRERHDKERRDRQRAIARAQAGTTPARSTSAAERQDVNRAHAIGRMARSWEYDESEDAALAALATAQTHGVH